MRLADAADETAIPDGMSVPAELQRRAERLAAIAQAKPAIEARAAERYAREQAAYKLKMAGRTAKEERTGRKPGGVPPAEPHPGPRPKDQINLTNADSRIMPTAGGGFEQAYNAQAAVDVTTMLIVAQHVSQHPNDKQEVEIALDHLEAVAPVIGSRRRQCCHISDQPEGNGEERIASYSLLAPTMLGARRTPSAMLFAAKLRHGDHCARQWGERECPNTHRNSFRQRSLTVWSCATESFAPRLSRACARMDTQVID